LATYDGVTVAEVQAEHSGWELEGETRERFIQELQKNFSKRKAQEVLHNVDKMRKKYFKEALLE